MSIWTAGGAPLSALVKLRWRTGSKGTHDGSRSTECSSEQPRRYFLQYHSQLTHAGSPSDACRQCSAALKSFLRATADATVAFLPQCVVRLALAHGWASVRCWHTLAGVREFARLDQQACVDERSDKRRQRHDAYA